MSEDSWEVTMRVEDLMTPPRGGCRTDTSLKTAAREMERQDCDTLHVVDEGGRFLGIVTRFEVDAGLLRWRRQARSRRVADLMHRPPPCHPEDPVDVPLRQMADLGVSTIPVVDGQGQVQGIIQRGEIARALPPL